MANAAYDVEEFHTKGSRGMGKKVLCSSSKGPFITDRMQQFLKYHVPVIYVMFSRKSEFF